MACLAALIVGCQTHSPLISVISQKQAMDIVSRLCEQRCSEFTWADEYGYMSVKGRTKEPRVPMDDLIRDALTPYGWTIWIPTEDYFNDYLFKIGIKTKDPNNTSEGIRRPVGGSPKPSM